MSKAEIGLKSGYVSLCIELDPGDWDRSQNGDTSASVLNWMYKAETDFQNEQDWDTSASVLNWISKAETGPRNGDTSDTALSWMS